jgi:pimeloyl-ACP methyl ester carboxylesterase
MSTFVLIPGAGGHGAYWNALVPELETRGHRAIAVDIEQDDPALGLSEYADIVEAAINDGDEGVILVAQSMGGFTAPMVATRRKVAMIVLLNAMIPRPGEKVGDWWEATASAEARQAADERADRDPEFDLMTHFLHDVPDEWRQAVLAGPQREVSDKAWTDRCEFDSWPDVATKVLVGRDDRFFPAEFQRRVAKQRLGLGADELAGGHLVALSNPRGLGEQLDSYAATLGG